jgi:hypothetical protein
MFAISASRLHKAPVQVISRRQSMRCATLSNCFSALTASLPWICSTRGNREGKRALNLVRGTGGEF